MSSLEKVMDRVRKLLQLARSTNEHEAAQAAARAADLMREYQLSEAIVGLDGDARPVEPIVECARLDEEDKYVTGRKRVAWKGAVANAVAKSYGARMYWWGGAIVAFGRESAIQAWRYTTCYLHGEVERLCDAAWSREGAMAEAVGQSTRAWKNAFRVGCAQAIAVRLNLQDQTARLARRTRVARETSETDRTQRALAVLDRDAQEVDAAYDAYRRASGFRTLSAIGATTNRTGYHAGREAGRAVTLGGGRAGLPPATPKLRGGR